MKYMKRLTGHTSLGLNSTRQSIFNHPYAKTIFLSVILGWSAPSHYPHGHANHGTQVYIGTPHVQIQVQPETQTHYHSTEEVYLPYGGTYRKTTESTAQYPAHSQYGYPYSNTQNKRTYGKVIQQGKYQSD